MKDNAKMIANLDTNVPLVADADTGYRGPGMVARIVTQHARANVAALHIKDQVQTKAICSARSYFLVRFSLVEPERLLGRARNSGAIS